MNYLAHIFLSGDNRKIQIGNFVGDAVKGHAYKKFSPDFRKGILLHRAIDDYTDHHPLVREAIELSRGEFGRYAGVITDIFFDYFLATGFRRYTGIRRSLEIMVEYKYLGVDPDKAIGFLAANRVQLQGIFERFFPDVQEMSRVKLNENMIIN